MVNLEGKIYSCKHCGTHLALTEDIVSKVHPPPFKFQFLFVDFFRSSIGAKS